MKLLIALCLTSFLISGLNGYCRNEICSGTIANSPNCLVCNAALGYVTNNEQTCIYAKHEKCLMVNRLGECLQCEPGYKPVGAACYVITLYDDPRCIRYSVEDICSLCQTGYIPSAAGNCEAIPNPPPPGQPGLIANCQYYSASGVCTYCAQGFYLSGNVCHSANVPQCLVYSGPVCLRCATGYKLVDAHLSFDYYAAMYASQTLGVLPPAVTSQCVLEGAVSNCVRYSASQACTQCAVGFYLTSINTCAVVTTLVPNCVQYSTNGVCLYCATNFYIVQNVCYPLTVSIPHCVAFSGPNACARCDPGYFLETPVLCTPVTTTIPQCQVYASATTCQYCATNFYPINSGTVCAAISVIVPNCAINTFNGCVQCADNYVLTFNNLNQAICVTQTMLPNCLRQTQSTCLVCVAGFYLSSGACQTLARAQNCHDYDATTDRCHICDPGFYPLPTGSCSQAGITLITNCLYYLNANTCYQCAANFMLSADGKTCSPAPIVNCVVFSSKYQCVYCVRNYYYDATVNKCILSTIKLENCELQSSDGVCIQCDQGY